MKATKKKVVRAPRVPQAKYTVELTMGALKTKATGNDESVFSSLSLPKVTFKCLLKVKNNQNKKVFESHFAPFMAKKLLTNIFVQKFQWKRITGKLS